MQLPQDWKRGRITLWIAGITAAAWAVAAALGLSDDVAYWAGFIPIRVQGVASDEWLVPVFLTPLTACLIHAGLWHLLFNLLFLLVCGRAVEAIVGGRQLLILYGVGAYAAAAAQYALDPASSAPVIGASGAIGSVIGAYAMLFGRNRVRLANQRLALWLNALWLVVAWTLLQVVVGLSFETPGARLAVGAHVGGFIAGLLLARPMLLFRFRKA